MRDRLRLPAEVYGHEDASENQPRTGAHRVESRKAPGAEFPPPPPHRGHRPPLGDVRTKKVSPSQNRGKGLRPHTLCGQGQRCWTTATEEAESSRRPETVPSAFHA